MLDITDSRFQPGLIDTAKAAGKLEKAYELPARSRNNLPSRVAAALGPAREQGLLPDFPLGTEMTDTEIELVGALKDLRAIAHSKPRLASLALKGGIGPAPSPEETVCLERLGLQAPAGIGDLLMRWTVVAALRKSRAAL